MDFTYLFRIFDMPKQVLSARNTMTEGVNGSRFDRRCISPKKIINGFSVDNFGGVTKIIEDSVNKEIAATLLRFFMDVHLNRKGAALIFITRNRNGIKIDLLLLG